MFLNKPESHSRPELSDLKPELLEPDDVLPERRPRVAAKPLLDEQQEARIVHEELLEDQLQNGRAKLLVAKGGRDRVAHLANN